MKNYVEFTADLRRNWLKWKSGKGRIISCQGQRMSRQSLGGLLAFDEYTHKKSISSNANYMYIRKGNEYEMREPTILERVNPE